MFYVGQEVVCINDNADFTKGLYPTKFFVGTLDGLTKGCIYTISEIIDDKELNELQLVLKELPRPRDLGESFKLRPPGFLSLRFRPVQKKKTDISIFTDMLKTKELETVDE